MLKKVLFFSVWGLFLVVVAVFGTIREAATGGWLDGVPALALLAPSVSLLGILIGYFYLNKQSKRLSYCLSFVCPAIFYIIIMFILQVHYGFTGEWTRILAPCFLASALIGGVSLLHYFLYSRFIRSK